LIGGGLKVGILSSELKTNALLNLNDGSSSWWLAQKPQKWIATVFGGLIGSEYHSILVDAYTSVWTSFGMLSAPFRVYFLSWLRCTNSKVKWVNPH